jgi:hypothetical protein
LVEGVQALVARHEKNLSADGFFVKRPDGPSSGHVILELGRWRGSALRRRTEIPTKVMLPAGQAIVTVRSIRDPTQVELDRLLTAIKPPEIEGD